MHDESPVQAAYLAGPVLPEEVAHHALLALHLREELLLPKDFSVAAMPSPQPFLWAWASHFCMTGLGKPLSMPNSTAMDCDLEQEQARQVHVVPHALCHQHCCDGLLVCILVQA